MSVSRRELFGMFRRPAPAVAPAAQDAAPRPAAVPASTQDRAPSATFSLDVFYAQRRAARLDPGWLPEVLPERCLARSFCTICVERCPTPGAIASAGGSPRIDPARCDGCGICVRVCPAPTLAFQLVRREAP
jgi:Pyruvate/2-oxoacid:ferredoxin oxidoreductase delta subunit